MTDSLTLYLARLQGGEVEQINTELPTSSLQPHEGELIFDGPVQVKGQAYVAGDELVLHLSIGAKASMPCRVCNEGAMVKIVVKDLYHTVELSQCPSAVLDLAPVIRELVLLEVPAFVECTGGCAKREELDKYLHKGENFHPFEDLK